MLFTTDVGIDLGTTNVIIYAKDKGVVLREPSVVAIDRTNGALLAVGEQAHRMLGRNPGNIAVVRPLRGGVIEDFDVTEKMLRYFMRRIIGRNPLVRPRVVVCVPSGVSEVEKRSVIDVTLDAGARSVRLIEEPVAAAIGAGVDITRAHGAMVADIGGGTTDIAVISMAIPVASVSVKVAGDAFDAAIVRYLRRKYNLLIGEMTAEQLKMQLGSAVPTGEEMFCDVTGRNLISGMPRTVSVSSYDITEALTEPVGAIIDAIHAVLEKTPPELSGDIYEDGLVLTGGGALLANMDVAVSERVHVPCRLADDPATCVARGTGLALENLDKYGQVIHTYKQGTAHLNK